MHVKSHILLPSRMHFGIGICVSNCILHISIWINHLSNIDYQLSLVSQEFVLFFPMNEEEEENKMLFQLDTPLSVIWDEIRSKAGSSNAAKYFRLARHWLRSEIAFSEFDREAREMIPSVDLHDRFINAVANILESNKSHRSFMDFHLSMGRLPLDPGKIQATFLLTAFQHGLQNVDPACSRMVFQHLKSQMASILEATLRLARPFKLTEAGFPHSFGGGTKMSVKSRYNEGYYQVRVHDLLDTLNFEDGLVPHQLLLTLLVKRLLQRVPNNNHINIGGLRPLCAVKMPRL